MAETLAGVSRAATATVSRLERGARRHFRRLSRWARSTTRNIWMQSQKTPVMQAEVRLLQRRIIRLSFDGTCGARTVYMKAKNATQRIASTASETGVA